MLCLKDHQYNSGTQTVHEHIVADVFGSKKSSSVVLVHEQQTSQKWCLFVLTAREIYMRTLNIL